MKLNRRQFTAQTAAAASALFAFPAFVRSKDVPEKLKVAVVGVGGRGASNLAGVAEENVVALCDVDNGQLEAAAQKFPGAKKYRDFRQLLDKEKGLDALVCSTPDFTHAIVCVSAMKQGLHVYCEKPMAHTVSEARAMTEAAAKYKRVTQLGTQIHATSNYRRVVELVKSGAIGPVTEVHVWAGAIYGNIELSAENAEIPKSLDYDLWLGPLPYRAYRKEYAPFHWRHFWHFGGGTLADFWCHFTDVAHWALDLTHPLTVHSQAGESRAELASVKMQVKYEYPARGKQPPVKLTWYQGGDKPAILTEEQKKQWGSGVLFIGEKGMLLADYGRRVLLPEDKFKGFQPPAPTIPDSIGHHAEWIKACKEGGQTTCNFGYSGPLTECALLGIVSHRVGNKKLEWDWKQLKATNCPEADKYIHHEYRPGWKL